jgi:integrase
LWVKPDGRKTWTFRWRDRVTFGQREAGLGSFTNERVTLAMARERADRYRDMVWNGLDPIAENQKTLIEARQALASRVSFKDCTQRYIDAHKASWRNTKHTAQWSSTLSTYAAGLMDMPVCDITDNDVLACLEPIWTDKTETATRVRQRIEAVLDWATTRKYRAGLNPARWKGHLDTLLAKPNRLKNVQHRPALPYAEAGQFMVKLRKVRTMAARALELQILTATRPGEATGAMWDEFDLQAKTWTIPAERMKANKSHTIPLSPQVIALLKSQPQVNDFLFPGNSLKKPMTTAAGMNLLKELYPGITQHGFRSTFRDWAADQTAFPREVIEHAMAHQLKDKAEAAYLRTELLTKRAKLMQAWASYCDAVPGKTASVTPIRGAK